MQQQRREGVDVPFGDELLRRADEEEQVDAVPGELW
jgi:hypothetical protein